MLIPYNARNVSKDRSKAINGLEVIDTSMTSSSSTSYEVSEGFLSKKDHI